MKLQVNNSEVPILGITTQESLSQYYDCYLITVPFKLNTNKLYLTTGTTETFYSLREELHGAVFVYTVVHENTYKLLNSTFPSFTGTCTLVSLLNRLGIKNKIAHDTGNVYWHIPSLSFVNFLDYLSRYALPSGGGAPFFNLNLNGVLELLDLKQIMTRGNPKEMSSYSLSEDTSYSDWILRNPGAFTLYKQTTSGTVREEFVIESNHGHAACYINDTTGREVDLYKRALTSAYYISKYTSRKLVFNCGIDSYKVGDLVQVDKTLTAVVYSRVCSVPLSNEPAQVAYTLMTVA